MDSSDVIEDSLEESNINKDATDSDCSVEDSLVSRPSIGDVVEESFVGDSFSIMHAPQNKPAEIYTPQRKDSCISSDEDINFASIARSSRRVRRIASDSDDESEQDQAPTLNSSFTNHRSVRQLDSDEDENEGSDSSFKELSNSLNFKQKGEMEDVEEKLSSSVRNSVSLQEKEPSSPNKNEQWNKPEDDSVKIFDGNVNKSINESKKEPSSPNKNEQLNKPEAESVKIIDVNESEKEPSSPNKNEQLNKPEDDSLKIIDENVNKSINESSDCSDDGAISIPSSFRIAAKEISSSSNSSDNSVRIVAGESSSSDSSDDGVISIPSSDTEVDSLTVPKIKQELETGTKPKLQQPTIDSMVQKMSLNGAGDPNDIKSNSIFCTAGEYANQSSKIANLRTDVLRCKNILRTANLASLPDKGALLILRQQNLLRQLSIEEEKLKNMVVNHKQSEKAEKSTWEQLQANSAYVVPKTFGKQALNTFTTQKSLTMDRLKNLHDSLATCPGDDTIAEDPKGIKVELMLHQKRALAWLIWREGQKPAGGILADDMGLGKTLTMISLILATKENDLDCGNSESESEEKENKWMSKNSRYKVDGGTLVICPATLIRQWESEVETKLKRNLLSTELYHGNRRETKPTRLAKYDIVITTYKLAQGEFEKRGPLYNIKWKRIILDEAHVIRNHKSLTSVAICDLKAKARWALTGTPVHNKELDLYALLKYLRCSPFDDLSVWKRWVANKNAGGQDRLNTVITSILLRRTKDQLQNQGSLQDLPEKKYEIIEVSLDSAEKKIYQKVLIFSRSLFIQFLRQRAEKNPEFTNVKGGDLTQTNDEEYNKMHRKIMQVHGNTAIKSHEILVLLLRLRQICCHPSLISSMLDQEDCAAEGIEEDGVDVDILDKLNNLNIDDEPPIPVTGEQESFSTQANKLLSTTNPVFAQNRTNEKLRVIQKIIQEKVLPNDDKVIIVSQWTSMLNLIMCHLKEAKIRCDILDGKVPVHKRNDLVVDFNNPNSRTKVLLLSLTAGGVGLNLVGANHLILVDLHWNPQLESQAQDRIYRVGQKKTVHVYKIVTSETIEEKIKALQDGKLNMANDILAGVRPGAGSKLSLNDLKMLFNVAD